MESLRDKVKEIEKEEIKKALRECNWIMSRAARNLGITESWNYRKNGRLQDQEIQHRKEETLKDSEQ